MLSNASDIEVITSAALSATRPAAWSRAMPARSRIENVRRRFAAVLPIAVATSAITFAAPADTNERRSAYSAT